MTYIVQRCESLATLFYLLGIYFSTRYFEAKKCKRKAFIWFAGATVACLFGVMTKEILVTAPLMILLIDRSFYSLSLVRSVRNHFWLYVSISITIFPLILIHSKAANMYSIIDLTQGEYGQQKITSFHYLLTQCEVLPHYLKLAACPIQLCLDYRWPVVEKLNDVLMEGSFVLLLLLSSLWAIYRYPKVSLIPAGIFILLAPTSSFYPLLNIAFEHRMYFPLALLLIGGCLLFCYFIRHAHGQQVVFARIFVIALIVIFTYLTICRNFDYRTQESIWKDTVDKAPNNPRAHYSLGVVIGEMEGRLNDALQCYEEALRLEPSYIDAHNNIGNILSKLGRDKDACIHFEFVLTKRSMDAEARANYALSLAKHGRTNDAIEQYERALIINQNMPVVHYNLAVIYNKVGNTEMAKRHYDSYKILSGSIN
ncbi:MAG: tetratricopeptide repeat protein [Planctomycetota bacterium]